MSSGVAMFLRRLAWSDFVGAFRAWRNLGHCVRQWVSADAPIQGVVFEQAFSAELMGERSGLLRCIGVTRPELEFAMRHRTPALVERLEHSHVYPRTMIHRKESIELAALTPRRNRRRLVQLSPHSRLTDVAARLSFCR